MAPADNVMVIPVAIILIVSIYLAFSLKDNTNKVVGAVIIEHGFRNIAPQIISKHYHSTGNFTVSFKSDAQTPITVTEVILTEKATRKKCNITGNTNPENIKPQELINITATCPKKPAEDVYLLSAQITYKTQNPQRLHTETGDLVGDTET